MALSCSGHDSPTEPVIPTPTPRLGPGVRLQLDSGCSALLVAPAVGKITQVTCCWFTSTISLSPGSSVVIPLNDPTAYRFTFAAQGTTRVHTWDFTETITEPKTEILRCVP